MNIWTYRTWHALTVTPSLVAITSSHTLIHLFAQSSALCRHFALCLHVIISTWLRGSVSRIASVLMITCTTLNLLTFTSVYVYWRVCIHDDLEPLSLPCNNEIYCSSFRHSSVVGLCAPKCLDLPVHSAACVWCVCSLFQSFIFHFAFCLELLPKKFAVLACFEILG